jgi:hypothetical protein
MIAAFEIARLFRRDLPPSRAALMDTPQDAKHFSTFWQFLDAIVSEELPSRTLAFVHRVEPAHV